MRVMITGGTGFVGSHTVAGLIGAGHDVKLLVRSPDRVRPALDPLGVGEIETVVGDVTDPNAVESALQGCDAVIHAASVYSLDTRKDAEIRRTNIVGTETVLGIALRLGLDPIVHVSSIGAQLGTPGAIIGPDSPPTTPPGAYWRSKADSDRIARGLQEIGAPIVITYPGGIWGPHDPHFGETCQLVDEVLRDAWPVAPTGGWPITDVRDLAKLHTAIIEPGRGPRRYMATAHNLQIPDILAAFSRVTGREFSARQVPNWTMLGPARLMDVVQPWVPFKMPMNFQGIYLLALNVSIDDSATRRDFGIEPRPVDESIGDTITWMVQIGHVPPKLAGRLGIQGRLHSA